MQNKTVSLRTSRIRLLWSVFRLTYRMGLPSTRGLVNKKAIDLPPPLSYVFLQEESRNTKLQRNQETVSRANTEGLMVKVPMRSSTTIKATYSLNIHLLSIEAIKLLPLPHLIRHPLDERRSNHVGNSGKIAAPSRTFIPEG